MSRQDYISQSKKPKKSPYKKTPPKSDSKFTLKLKLSVLFLLCCIAVFSYFLWVIKDKEPLPDAPKASPEAVQVENELPEPPVEKWAYVDALKNKEIEEGEYQVEKKGPYKMQCGSFKTRAQAESLKAQIAFSGLSSQIKGVTGSNGTWFKVYLGPYKRKRNAEKDKHALKRNNIKYCEIWLW